LFVVVRVVVSQDVAISFLVRGGMEHFLTTSNDLEPLVGTAGFSGSFFQSMVISFTQILPRNSPKSYGLDRDFHTRSMLEGPHQNVLISNETEQEASEEMDFFLVCRRS
jgi:hypothetical protein